MRLLASNPLRYRRQILALKEFFVGRKCTVLMLDDRTAEGPDLQLHSIAHGVIALYLKPPVYGQARRQLQVLKFRGSDFATGFHDLRILNGGITVFPRLVASEHGAEFNRTLIKSGVSTLDALLGGGVERGTSTLLVGPPGSGKSTIALQYAVAATARGDHAAAFIFDETRAALLGRSAGVGLTINEGDGPGQITLRQIDPVEISPGEFAAEVRRSVEQDHARVVIIDSLNGYLNAMFQDNYLAAQLHELLSYLSNNGVTTMMVIAQSGMLGANMTSPIDASYLADCVVLLRYFEHNGAVKKAISVMKKRTGGHEDSIRQIWFDAHGIHLSEPLLGLRGVLTGVPVAQVKLAAYIVSATMAALAAVLIIGWQGSAINALGQGYELRVIASTVIGGANLMGGEGGTYGAVIGAALIEVIRNSLLMEGIDSNWQGAFVGVFIVLAVLLEKIRGRRRA